MPLLFVVLAGASVNSLGSFVNSDGSVRQKNPAVREIFHMVENGAGTAGVGVPRRRTAVPPHRRHQIRILPAASLPGWNGNRFSPPEQWCPVKVAI
ncbi:MAG TPA: hypothetical protein VFC17_08420 [Candidatus Limnocylindrales bacterium]|nr:hypothetical protein [Candidatus Limnocylindrales bacterium]